VIGRIQLEQRLERKRSNTMAQASHCGPPHPGCRR
jgi:hypothetical protein